MARTFVAASSQSLDATSAVATAAPLTMACWFKPSNAAGGASKTLMSLDDGASAFSAFLLRSVASTAQCSALANGGGSFATSTSAAGVSNGTWAHHAAVFASSSVTAYLNATAATVDTAPVTPANLSKTHIGVLWVSTQFADGDIAEAGIWNVALTAAEITSLAAGVSPLLIRPSALIAYWPLLGTTSPEIELRGRNELTVTGATASAHPRMFRPTPPAMFIKAVTPAAPATTNTPAPTDASTLLYSTFTWVSARATKYDLYLGTAASPPLLVSNVQEPTYVPTLLPSTTYHWKIVAINAGGSTTGPIWSFTTPATTDIIFQRSGSTLASVRLRSLTIRDVLNAAPNTATMEIGGVTAPAAGNAIKIGLASLDPGALLFAGQIQSVDPSYEGQPDNLVWPANLIDRTFEINKRRPVGTWSDVSATTVTQELVDAFAPGFTTAGVEVGLPTVSISFDESETFMDCLSRLAKDVGGYCYVDYSRDVHLFLEETTDAPDPVDASNQPFLDPPVSFSTDLSQIRTRGIGKGHGEQVLCDVSAGETILPIEDAVMFPSAGGAAIAATTSDGAQTEVLTYSGVQLGGGGSLVGPGAAPSSAPVAAVQVNTGLSVGVYKYGYTDVTAAGESLPSPMATQTINGTLSSPTSAATAGAATAGGSVTDGTHKYAVTFVTAAGETTEGPLSNQINVLSHAGPSGTPSLAQSATADDSHTAGNFRYKITFVYSDGTESLPSPASASVAIGGFNRALVGLEIGGANVTARKMYWDFNASGSFEGHATVADNTSTSVDFKQGTLGAGPGGPPSSVASSQTVPVASIPIGPTGVTSRKLYRTASGGTQLKLLTTIADNVTTTYSDTTADGSLGANVPTTNTTVAASVALSGIAVGPSGTTSRKVYRTAANGSQLKLLATLADNTTTTYSDTVADGSLGANVPTGDTSGLTQPSGQVNAGSTSLLTAGAAPFSTTGGWVIMPGGQFARYTGISTNTLTGIPASGPGSITTTVLYGSQVLPAPALTGINGGAGLVNAIAKGSSANIRVVRDDLPAQAALGALELDDDGNATDGIHEYQIVDERRGVDSLTALVDADLALFKNPIVTVHYCTRDTKTRSGKTVHIYLPEIGLSGDFVIQDVTITFDAPGQLPRYAVTASSVKFSLEDLLRRVLVA